MYLCEMLPYVIYRYYLRIVRLFVISSMIMSSFGVLVLVLRLCQKFFLAKRKALTLNQLGLYQGLRSSYVDKFYELDRLM